MVHSKKYLVLSLCALCANAPANAIVAENEDFFGIVITKERTVVVKTSDYGTLDCASIEFKRADKKLVIVNGKSDLGFSGGMIYEADNKGNTELFAPHSVWGGIIHHAEPGFDDATIQVRLAVASLCQDALFNRPT